MADQPPPPPPHGGQGGAPRSGGLPPGKYDIFVIPEHSAGSGFLYLPSLQPNVNSFVAGFASALIVVVLGQSMAPAFRTWWESFQGLGNMGMVLLIVGVGFGAWALGRTQQEGGADFGSGFRPKPSASGGSAGFTSGAGAGANGHASPPPRNDAPGGGARYQQPGSGGTPHGARQHAEDYYPTGNTPPPHNAQNGSPKPEKPKSAWEKAREQYKGSWERAREETRKKEEERKAKEAEQKRREETAKRLAELRAKEAKERQQRELEKQKKELLEKQKKELLEKQKKEALEKEKKEKEEKEAKAAATSPKNTGYAYSGVGERVSMWPDGKPPTVPKHSPTPSAAKNGAPDSPGKKPPAPTAKTYMSEATHSYRPYDQPPRKKSFSSYAGSESSWAPSHTTHRTTPPASMRGPYTTKDPDKIVISAVYLFMNQFAKTPASQLISGIGAVTDGLILRITTEGLFIDDDVRGVPQREWDVKAWTLKQVEVWCPPHCLHPPSSTTTGASSASSSSHPNFLHKMAQSRTRNSTANKALTGEEADAFLVEMLRACNSCCRLGLCESTLKNADMPSSQTGEWSTKGLHIVRATLRDQESKRYLFVLEETESWKVAAGLQRLRRGTQVRQLGVSGMTPADAKSTLEMLGWGN